MPLFHFHLDECGTATQDADGSEYPDLAAARHAAIAAAREILCEEMKGGEICMSCHIDIADANGTRLERVKFSDAVKVVGLPAA